MWPWYEYKMNRWVKHGCRYVFPPLLPCSCQNTFCLPSRQRNHHFHFSSLHRQVWKPLSSYFYDKNVLWEALWLISLFIWLNTGSVLYSFCVSGHFVDVCDLCPLCCLFLCKRVSPLHLCDEPLPENVKCDFSDLTPSLRLLCQHVSSQGWRTWIVE